ncbi:hypothetical protein EMIHUDRAFT_203558 [Emiliania huxleyi CCMP1516]|uniref:Reelin domain-containing protein n=2 Tax=Emiliania huxleyi TaxID=2903 RepID=A0A0D3K2W1_EMIH1|nr:hypothetical protein EMIHUDRAFT_203558 [Emiliania huxleyi CCMP1516]EOD30096.1 hypothetical protein EMIHUDRAFT_203558 [Emiliania huxleyi CCMP1516]|eukprot:XP_005782525.1 hypothetical protein EMIHUDRAFT_203558 [Emiliania huxleyi CCMP1516]
MLSPSTLVVAANDGLAYAKHPCVVLILLLGTSATGASFSLACSLFCGWAWLQALVGFTPSLCRGGGGCAATMLLTSVLLSATAPPPPRAGTLYFELSATADFNISIGASRSGMLVGTFSTPSRFHLSSIGEADGVAGGEEYSPVLLLPQGSYARLTISAVDRLGHSLVSPATFELGPDDAFPWAAAARLALPGAAAAADNTSPAASSSGATGGLLPATPAPPLSANRRRLRGRVMRGMLGSRPLTRGVGSFGSPHRGVPSAAAHGTSPRGSFSAPHRAGYGGPLPPRSGGYGGLGGHEGFFRPPMYRSVFADPFISGALRCMVVAHVLRSPHHHHRSGGGSLGGVPPPPGVAPPEYYYGAAAVPNGTRLRVVPAAHHRALPAQAAADAGGSSCSSRVECGLTAERLLLTPHDRYVLVSAVLRLPPPSSTGLAPGWPIALRVQHLHLAGGATAPGGFAAPLLGLQEPRPTPAPPPPALWLLLLAATLFGLYRGSQPSSTAPAVCADGELVGSRVQTEWTVEEGGDGQWYAGTVVALYPGGGAAVEHDDGSLSSVYTLRGESDDEERGLGGLRGLPVAAPVAAHGGGAGAYPGVQAVARPV